VRRLHRDRRQAGGARIFFAHLGSDVVGREVTTIGAAPSGDHPVQKAGAGSRSAVRLLPGRPDHAGAHADREPKASHDQNREAMSGNIAAAAATKRIENAVYLASTGV